MVASGHKLETMGSKEEVIVKVGDDDIAASTWEAGKAIYIQLAELWWTRWHRSIIPLQQHYFEFVIYVCNEVVKMVDTVGAAKASWVKDSVTYITRKSMRPDDSNLSIDQGGHSRHWASPYQVCWGSSYCLGETIDCRWVKYYGSIFK